MGRSFSRFGRKFKQKGLLVLQLQRLKSVRKYMHGSTFPLHPWLLCGNRRDEHAASRMFIAFGPL